MLKLFNMKLKISHLFFLLLAVLVVYHFVYDVKEYFDSNDGLPEGIPKSQIQEGDEDLYIKKTEIVPPVCPKCPDVTACPKPAKCAPCPPCGRCPEPAFECKKVPNYKRQEDNMLPRPVLSDFSQFGM